MINRNSMFAADPGAAVPVRIPVQTTFRHMSTSPAVEFLVGDETQSLARFFDGITHCRVVLAAPHRHHRHGRRSSVHVELSVPHCPVVVTHEPTEPVRKLGSARDRRAAAKQAAAEDLYAAVRAAFATARRQIENHVRRLRGDPKTNV